MPRRHLASVLLMGALLAFGAGCAGGSAPDGDQGEASLSSDGSEEERRTFMGREIAPVRGHELAEWFERPGREHSELPDRLVRALPLDSSDVVADIGAGTGYFTFRLSKVVPDGKVLAIDIDPEMLQIIGQRMREESIANIELIESTPSDPRLPESAVDVALIVDSYHEFSHPREMLDGIFRGLRRGGHLVVVEYRGEDPTIDVEEQHRMTEAQIRLEMESAGFEWVETRDFLPQQHVVIFRRPVA